MNKIVIILFSIALLFTACKRDDNNNPNPETQPSMENLDISDGFDWKTTNDYTLTITGNQSNMVDVSSKDNMSYQKAFLTANIPYTMKITVPSYADSIYLVYCGKKVGLELGGESLSYTFN